MAYKNKDKEKEFQRQYYLKYKDKKKAAKKKYYLANTRECIERAGLYRNTARKRNKLYVTKHLSVHPCIDCGNTDHRVLDFDHVRGKKKKDICRLSNNAASLEILQQEIDKCEVRCSNCHRIKTYNKRTRGS